MQPRIDARKVAPGALAAMSSLERYLAECGLESSLLDLVRLRASQINGCAYCVDIHSLDLRAAGEAEQRLYALPVWQHTPFFTDRERAALLWTEHVTLIASNHVPDAIYEQVRLHFTDAELVNLTMALASINAWNRLAISFRNEPGHYKPAKRD